MKKSVSKKTIRPQFFNAKGLQLSRLRQRKYKLVRDFGLPEDILGGSLVVTHRRCGKSTCHCAEGKGHPMWSLTFSVDGIKTVQPVSSHWLPWLEPLVESGRNYKAAVVELMGINAQLLNLWHQQERKKQASRRPIKKSKIRRRTTILKA